jgi:short-subunit dehydrogenase
MKKILIIGASSGIGKELALAYANAGHTVGITGRRVELLSQIRKVYPQNIEFSAQDISKDNNQGVLETIIQKINGMDIIIISAGIGFINKELTWNREKQTIDTNITGFTEIADFAYNYFSKQKSGQIVAISSIAAIRGIDSCPAYSASKAYIQNYLEALRKKSAKEKANVSVTTILPGFVDTQMAQGDGLFWVASAGKAARQMMRAIARKKTLVYVTKRWRIIAYFLKILPGTLYNRL